jgi:DNA-binding Lrp family transcriptional regulator
MTRRGITKPHARDGPAVVPLTRTPPITYRTLENPPIDWARRACEVCEVVAAYVLIQTEVGKAGQVAGAATAINGVQHAYPLTGPYDVIVRAEARNIDSLGQLVVSRIQAITGVTRTLTCPVVHL